MTKKKIEEPEREALVEVLKRKPAPLVPDPPEARAATADYNPCTVCGTHVESGAVCEVDGHRHG